MPEVVPGLVSTVIPVFNRPEMLRESVESVLAQTWRPIEIIISDDGSTDSTPDVGRELERRYPDVVRYIWHPNQGVGGAREAGRIAARGEFIQYLDSDDRLLPRKFESQVSALRAWPECSIAYGTTQLIDANGRILKEEFKWTAREFDELFPALLVDRWWNTHTPLWRRELCDAIGSWSSRSMGEDWEYEARAAARRVRLVHCGETVSQHRHHQQARLTGNDLKAEHVDDTTHLLRALWSAALQANIDPAAPELRHFSRWAFLVSRQAAAMGMGAAAADALGVARQAAKRSGGRVIDMHLFRAAAFFIGWRNAERLTNGAVTLLHIPATGHTMPICNLDDIRGHDGN